MNTLWTGDRSDRLRLCEALTLRRRDRLTACDGKRGRLGGEEVSCIGM